MIDQKPQDEVIPTGAASRAEGANLTDVLCGTGEDVFDEYINGEPACLVCGGEGWVEGCDYLDWQDDGYDDLIPCTSCHGSGLARDMTWC